MISIDLNCDMGESFGAWTIGNDRALMDYCTSINIACGFHAGDASVIRKTIETALEKRIAIGAHPSFPDLQGFGRRPMQLSAQEVFDTVLYQVAAVYGMTAALGGKLHHVKPHGALYNEAARKPELAEAIARAIKAVDECLIIYGLSNSFLISEAEKIGLKTASEVFADRTYNSDGSLTARSEPNALIHETNKAVNQVLQMIQTQTVTATNGETVPLRAETVCIHGDGGNALEFAAAVREKLTEKGIRVCPV
jgi:UPF0271 protein